MAVNAQKIKQFNQRNQAVPLTTTTKTSPTIPPQAAPSSPPPPPGGYQGTPSNIKLHSRMSASDIALLQKDAASLTKEEAIRRKALETKETLRQQEEEAERQRQEQLDEAKRQGRYDRVAKEQVIHGLKAMDKATFAQRSWIMRASTVGGIGTLLAIIVLFLLAVVPVDKQGNTRLFLIWLTLTGKTHTTLTPDVSGLNNNSVSGSNAITPDISTTKQEPPAQPPITFTLPEVFQGGGVSLLDSLFN